MDFHNKIVILKKYFNKYVDERKIDDMENTLSSMKILHGKVISTIMEVKDSREANRLGILSDLEIISKKMIDIIIESSDNYDKMLAEKNNKDHNNMRKDAEIKLADDKKTLADNIRENSDSDNSIHNNAVKKLNKNAASLILFYADWCGPCQAFLPTWNYIEENIKHENLNIVKFSCVKHKAECDKISFIRSFPTVVLFSPKNNAIVKYEDQRDPNAIIDFLNLHLKLGIEHIK